MGNMRGVVSTLLLICFQLALLEEISEAENKDLVPHWQNLECEEGYKYLFSEIEHNWNDARAECELYGGWLVDVNSIEEHNCIMRYGKSQGFDKEFWIDANDQASRGTWVHASTGKDLTWINPKWTCGCSGNLFCSSSGDAMVMMIRNSLPVNGGWCDVQSPNIYNFICKAPI